MQTTAVYSCVRALTETIASLPLRTYRYTKEGKAKSVENTIYYLLHDEPNPEMTSFAFRETLVGHLLLWGNAYAQIIRDGRGKVLALYPLMSDRIEVNRTEYGEIFYIPGLGFDELIGYSPITRAKNAIEMAIATEDEIELNLLSIVSHVKFQG